jgi:hypothetical protein
MKITIVYESMFGNTHEVACPSETLGRSRSTLRTC